MKLRWLMIMAVGLMISAFLSNVDANDDHEEIQGTWQAVSTKDSGRKVPQDSIRHLRWDITKDKITYRFANQTTEFAYELDPTKKPKWIDLRVVGEEKEKGASLGIYELEGDNLKICISESLYIKQRPTEFESKPDSPNDVLFIFKRDKR